LDSDYVVIGLANSTIKVFSSKTGVLARTLMHMGHGSGVWGVCLVSRGGWMELESAKKGKRKMSQGLAQTLGKEMRRALGLHEDDVAGDFGRVSQSAKMIQLINHY
jgi:F-box and WD-40 domain protein CDC4